jgi:hypothetical protein
VVVSYIRKNRRRQCVAVLSFGRARYARAKVKLEGIQTVI